MLGPLQISDPDAFESFCGSLCTELDLGAPIHLAKGSDRGKDLVARTPLQTGGDKVYLIHVECKFTESKRTLGVRDLITHCAWAEARRVDLLILMTNARLTAAASDWLEEMSAQRSFPVIVWDGEYLGQLWQQLEQDRPSRMIRSVHRHLVARWKDHIRPQTGQRLPPTIRDHSPPKAPPRLSYFVDRHEPIACLNPREPYSTAAITGPAGIGKTVLVHELLANAAEAGYAPIAITANSRLSGTLRGLTLAVAEVLSADFGDDHLRTMLRGYDWEDQTALATSLANRISRYRLLVVVEDSHWLSPLDDLAIALETLATSLGSSKLIITSRTNDLWRGCLLSPDKHVRLLGFSQADILEFFTKRGSECTDEFSNLLADRYRGWPLLVSLSFRQHSTQPFMPETATSSAEDPLHVAAVLSLNILAGLSTKAATLLRALNSLRLPLAAIEIQLAIGLDAKSFRSAWDELISTGLVNPTLPYHRCSHDLVREVLRPALNQEREADRALGSFLLLFDQDPERVCAAASHLVCAGDIDRAARVVVAKAKMLLRAGLCGPILHLIGSVDSSAIDEVTYLRLVLVRVECHEVLGQTAEAVESLRTAFIPSAVAILPTELAVRYRYTESRCMYFLGDYAAVLAATDEGLRLLEEDDDALDPSDHDEFLALFLAQKGRLSYIRRDMDSAELHYERALQAARKSSDPGVENMVEHRLAMVQVRKGNLDEAYTRFLRVAQNAERQSDAKRWAYSLHRMGVVRLLEGRFEEAIRLLQESLSKKVVIGHQRGLVYGHAKLGSAFAMAGNLSAGEAELSRAIELADSLGQPKERAMVFRAMAGLRDAQHDPRGAGEWARRAAGLFSELGLDERAREVMLEFPLVPQEPTEN